LGEIDVEDNRGNEELQFPWFFSRERKKKRVLLSLEGRERKHMHIHAWIIGMKKESVRGYYL